jgi:transposase
LAAAKRPYSMERMFGLVGSEGLCSGWARPRRCFWTGGPMDGESFLAWVVQMLAPTLRPGDIVVMDNLAAHKVAGIRQAIEAYGAELHYLPPYSPDLNPIKNAFAKLKAHVRKSAARTINALERAAANALQPLMPNTAWNKSNLIRL